MRAAVMNRARGLLRRGSKFLVRRRMNDAHAKHRAANPSAYDELDHIIADYRANGGLEHPRQHYKLFCLQELLEKRKPKAILELGSGTTTAVFANYVRSHPDATLTVIDESAHWLENARRIAKIEASEQFSLLTATSERTRRDSWVSYEYQWRSDEEFDFIIVDGPTLHKEKTAINGNILDHLGYRPETIVVDGRGTTAMLLDKILTGYRSELSEVIAKHYYPGYRYFSVFTAEDGTE